MKTKKVKKAPTLLSDAIELALEDLEVVEQSDDYKVEMGEWHTPVGRESSVNSQCYVCFAGSVMAVTHQMPWGEYVESIQGVGDDWESVYRALDCIRKGFVQSALNAMNHIKTVDWLTTFMEKHNFQECEFSYGVVVTPYHENPLIFKREMRDIAKALKKEGL